jgi:hypothetical protein
LTDRAIPAIIAPQMIADRSPVREHLGVPAVIASGELGS